MKYQLLPAGRRTQTGVYASLRAEDGTVIGPLWVPKEKIGPAGISCDVKNEKSCGAVIFREKGQERRYLLLHYERGHWDFVKGHIENGRAEKKTLLREITEEIGLEEKGIKFIDGYRMISTYYHFWNDYLVHKEVVYYLAKTATEKIHLASPVEHVDYTWLPYDEALEKLTYENSKEILETAENFLIPGFIFEVQLKNGKRMEVLL